MNKHIYSSSIRSALKPNQYTKCSTNSVGHGFICFKPTVDYSIYAQYCCNFFNSKILNV